jgi:hypothetical protein
MRLVELRNGQLELAWTWLPYWIATGDTLHHEVTSLMRDVVIINGMPPDDDSLDRIDKLIIRLLDKRFRIPGLGEYLGAIRHVNRGSAT